MLYELRKTVVLVGLMGAGKTAVGRALARSLEVGFVDQDDEIEAAANASVSEIFAEYGEAFFREKESQVLDRLLDGPPCILSTGGGAFIQARNRDLIASRAIAVWLNADLNLLWTRVRHRSHRPLLRTENPFATLQALYDARYGIYALAPVHVRPDPSWSPQNTAEAVIHALADRSEILKERHDAPR
ncbi:MAG: shikimate kinase [Pseudomonadota bacterium]